MVLPDVARRAARARHRPQQPQVIARGARQDAGSFQARAHRRRLEEQARHLPQLRPCTRQAALPLRGHLRRQVEEHAAWPDQAPAIAVAAESHQQVEELAAEPCEPGGHR